MKRKPAPGNSSLREGHWLLADATPARAIELCDQLRSTATELRNVLVQLGAAPAWLVLRAPAAIPTGKTLSRVDAARKCGVSVSTFDGHVRPHLPEVKLGRRRVFLESDVEAFLLRDEPGAKSASPVRARVGRRRVGAETIVDPKARAILERLKKGGKSRG